MNALSSSIGDSSSLSVLQFIDLSILDIERAESTPDTRCITVRFRYSEALSPRCDLDLLDVFVVRIEVDGLGEVVVQSERREDRLGCRDQSTDVLPAGVVLDELDVTDDELAVGFRFGEAFDDSFVRRDEFLLTVDVLECVDQAVGELESVGVVEEVGERTFGPIE